MFMKLCKFVLRIVLGFLNVFFKYLKVNKNKITIISMTQDHLSGDFKMIYEYLKDKGYSFHFVLFNYRGGLVQQFFYFLNCMKQLYAIHTSKIVLINDNNYVVSHYKRKETKVIQIWHASGAVKKFGNAIKREYEIKNYDAIICTSPIWKKPYSEAFNVSENQVYPLGIPHVDKLFDQDYLSCLKEKMYQTYPELRGKYVVLYAPTFRGNIIDGMSHYDLDINRMMNELEEDVYFLYKFHPLLGNIKLSDHPHVMNMNDEDLYALFSISDCLISDYSSVIFDYSLLNKKMVFFAPDLKSYQQDRGFYINYLTQEDIPLCLNEEELLKELKMRSFDLNQIEHFRNQYFYYQDGKSLERIEELIKTLMKGEDYVQ